MWQISLKMECQLTFNILNLQGRPPFQRYLGRMILRTIQRFFRADLTIWFFIKTNNKNLALLLSYKFKGENCFGKEVEGGGGYKIRDSRGPSHLFLHNRGNSLF